jgi:hypothetical protein
MNTKLIKSLKVYLLVLLFLTSSPGVFAQRPPTGGPNPPPTKTDKINLLPFIISGGGIALGVATRMYLKNRGPKVAVREHLPTYLLNRNILPTPDALQLMYTLNPGLHNVEVIRANKKLVHPDFPEIPKSQINTSGNAVQTTTSMPAILKEQVSVFKSSLNTFRRTKITIRPANKELNMETVNAVLMEVEKDIASHARENEESNSIKYQLMTDLLLVLNQTLNNSINTKILGEHETTLIKEIRDDLSELLFPVINIKLNPGKSGQLYFRNTAGDKRIIFASLDLNAVFYGESSYRNAPNGSSGAVSNANYPINTNMLQGFAFAIYKLNANGVPITKGPEVEGRYFIQYVMPALKNIPEAYHNLSPPLATYTAAFLPPAKYFFIVKDINGNLKNLQNPLIDTKDAFKNPQREEVKNMIIVPIFVTK